MPRPTALLAALPAAAAAAASADGRRLSFQQVAGYAPGSQVTDHCAIDLDQAAIVTQLGTKTPGGYDGARAIYNEGGHSKSYATVTLDAPLGAAVSKGDAVLGKNEDGVEVTGKMYKDVPKGEAVIKVQYATFDDQDNYVGCQVGALVDTNMEKCFAATGALAFKEGGQQVERTYTYDPATENKNGRTIAGFSTGADAKMNTCATCPYKDFKYFLDYYGRSDYAHHWVESAFDKKRTSFDNGNADFSGSSYDGMAEYIKKGTAYMNIFMYVIREYEDAIDDCNLGCVECNDSSVHAWDEGVCFYTGSLEGEVGTDDGELLHQLADKRCANFRTCGKGGDEGSGTAKVNHEMFDLMGRGQDQLLRTQCSEARKTSEEIIKKMYIPLIQGTQRYAYKVNQLQGGEKEKAEGSVFAASVLPRIHAASPSAARTIYNNMKVGATSTDHVAVKQAFESVYSDLDITCEDVGGLWFDDENKYYEGMEPCGSVTTHSSSALRIGLGSLASLGAAMAVYLSL